MSGPGLVVDTDTVECGERVRVDVDAAAAVVVELCCDVTPAGGATSSTVVAAADAGPSVGWVELSVPESGPISYSGRLFSVAWTIRARGASADADEVPVTVLPRGGVALWARQAAPPPAGDDSGA